MEQLTREQAEKLGWTLDITDAGAVGAAEKRKRRKTVASFTHAIARGAAAEELEHDLLVSISHYEAGHKAPATQPRTTKKTASKTKDVT